MTTAATFDAGPLSWVKGEIDLALDRVAQGLQQFGANTADLTQIKFCRTHLHQVRGALTIVGLDGVTQFTDSLEALLADLESGRQPADTPRIALIGRSVSSIRRYLDDLLAGDPNQPLRLLDLYRQIAAARGLPAPAASDLFFPDLSTRPQLPDLTLAQDGAQQLKGARARFQKGLLVFIKSPEVPIGALELKLAAQMAASADASPTLRGFWWVTSGFFTALGEKSIAADADAKSICSRIDQQLRQQVDGSRAVPEKLMREVLFQVAIARSRNPDVLAIKAAYDLAALIPSSDTKTVSQAAQLEPFLKRLKEISTASEEAWNKFCTGSGQALPTFCDAAGALDQGAERLAHTDFRRLVRAVGSAANWIREDTARHNEVVALEMATGVLLIGNAIDNFTRLGPDFVHQVDVMVARLHACISGTAMPPGGEVPVLDEMTRRAQEKLLVAQVVKEIQSSLGQIEQSLDTFFREPDQKDQLAGCRKPISQIIGALSILGHMDAVVQLQDSARRIARFQAADYQPDQKDFEQVARQLSALGFFVEALQSGVSDYKAFIAGLDVKPSKGEVAEPAVAQPVPGVSAEPSPPTIDLASTATAPVSEAPAASEPETAAAPEAPAAPAATATTAPAASPEIDAELLEIFLEEANEVIGTIGEQIAALRARPSDTEALTTLRRAFHTLKGSSRMVGLMAFGDVAWVIEQVHNLWLRQEKPVDATLIALVENSRKVFAAWIGHLEGNGEALPDCSALLAQGEKLKGGETISAPGRPIALAPEPPPPPEAIESVATTAPEVSFNLELPELEISEPFANASFADLALAAPPPAAGPKPPESALTLELTELPAQANEMSLDFEIADLDESPSIELTSLIAQEGALDEESPAPLGASEIAEIAAVGQLAPAPEPAPVEAGEAELDNIELVSIVTPTESSEELTFDLTESSSVNDAMESIDIGEPDAIVGTQEVALEAAAIIEHARQEAAAPNRPAAAPAQTITVAPTLHQIFLEEAHTHVATLQRGFGELEISPSVPTSSEMLRAAHTLGSIAGTVGFPSALAVGHGIEAALLRREKSANPASMEALETLRIAIAELDMMLAAIERNEPLGDPSALVMQIDDLYPCFAAETIEAAASTLAGMAKQEVDAAPAADEPLPDDQIDDSLLPIFLEEAADLVSGINERLSMWSASPYDTDTIHALTRLLHTLKGSARMAGAMRLGGLTHRLESSIESALRAGGADPVLIAALQADFDDIAEMSENLGRGAPEIALEAVADDLGYATVDSAPLTELRFDEAGLELSLDQVDAVATPEPPISREAPIEPPALGSEIEPGIEIAAPELAVEAPDLAPLELPALEVASLAESEPLALEISTVESAPVNDAVLDFDFTPAPGLLDISAEATLLPSAPEILLAPAVAPAPAPSAAALPEDQLDPELLPIFLEEAVEIVRAIYQQLDAWQAAPTDSEATQGLARSLHTLKGSARMAGAMSLGALTHTLESRAEEAAKSGQASIALIEEMKHAFDAIAQIVERLQRGESLATMTIELPQVSAASVAPPTESAAVGEARPAPRPAGPAPKAAVVAPAAPAAVAAAVAAQRKDTDAAKAMLRVPAGLIDNLVNDAGELSIARARIEGEMRSLKQSLLDLTENVIRLRRQLREIEIQAESQMQSRIAVSTDGAPDFDPLELDRFTRFQEVTRMMAESVNDVATVQLNLLKNLDEANAGLAAQARLNRELQQALMSVRMVPFSSITERLYRIVRQTAKELRKKADLDVQGASLELDQNVINKMIGPLEHLLRNAISHGIEMPEQRVEQGKDEMGDIRLSLRQEGNEVIITMRDDGAGLNFSRIREKAIAKGLMSADDPYDERKLTEMIFSSGFSTATEVSQIAGRGVGMDVVMTEVTNLGGRIDITSESGKGSVFRVYLPLTLAVTNAVIVRIGSRYYAIPAAMIDQVREVRETALAEMREAGGTEWLGNHYPFHFLPHLLGEANALPEARRMYWLLYLHSGLQRVVVQVDELQSSHEIVVKNIGPQLARVVGIAGATVTGDGRVILILNPVALAARAQVSFAAGTLAREAAGGGEAPTPVVEPEKAIHLPTVLVVDDSLTVRKITSRLLAREGYQVMLAKDGQDALEQMVEVIPDVILSDIEMPRMDGFELARNIRNDARLVNIPVVMISSRTADKHRSHAAELGVNHFLGKPYQEDELLSLIAGFIAEQRAR